MAKAATKTAKKIPFGLRLKAWWEGYDADELARRANLGQTSAPAPERAPKPVETTEIVATPLQGETSNITEEGELPIDPWDQNRIDVAQLIWGRGFCGPGGPEYVVAMSKLLTLSPEMSMMHLGAGLGGPARTLAEHFGVWVTGYESSPSLVAGGNQLSTMAGMAKKAALALLDLTAEKPFERKYDRLLADNFVSLIANKLDLLRRIEDSMKPDGLALFTEFFMSNDSVLMAPEFRDWIANEPSRIMPITHAEFLQQLTQSNYIVRVDDDISEDYVHLIDKAWAGADKIVLDLYNQPGQAHLVGIVLKEAELWSRRAQLIRKGLLSYRRILAAKKDKHAGW